MYLTPYSVTDIFLYIIFGEFEGFGLLNSVYLFVAQGNWNKVHEKEMQQLDKSILYILEESESKCIWRTYEILNKSLSLPVP